MKDLLIIGHGLAGAVLAETARLRGLSVQVFDSKKPGNASTVAAGMVNPLVFRRDVPSWHAGELLPLAMRFHAAFDQRMATTTWHPMPLVKLFPTPVEAAQWERAMAQPESAPFMARVQEPEIDAAPIPAPHGHGTVPKAAWLDVAAFLAAQREQLVQDACFTAGEVHHRDIEHGNGTATVGGVQGRWIVRCEGPFADVPGLVPVKGETLTVHLPDLHLSRMVHRGIFLLPLGEGSFRTGSTFKWTDVWEGPTAEARNWMLAKLKTIVDAPMELVAHEAGVRPASRDRRPLLGVTGPREAVFNGLGARGVLLAPWCAEHLLGHLFDGHALDKEVDVARSA